MTTWSDHGLEWDGIASIKNVKDQGLFPIVSKTKIVEFDCKDKDVADEAKAMDEK